MKWTGIRKLKKGDWIITRDLEDGKFVGKFIIGRVSEIKVNLDNYEEIDIIKGDIQVSESGYFKDSDGHTGVLNNKEVKALSILRTKLKTLKGLKDETTQRKY